MARPLDETIQDVAEATRDFLFFELRRTSPVRTGRYRAGWRRIETLGITNPVPYAIFVATTHRSRHFELALDEAEDYFTERLSESLRDQTITALQIEVFLGRYL